MGANVSLPPSMDISESSLVYTGNATSRPMFSVQSCVCKLANFKETALCKYSKDTGKDFHEKIKASTTYKGTVNIEFGYEKLINNALRVRLLSHPAVIRVSASIFEPKLASIFLVMEPNLPLQSVISSASDDELLMGLHSILQAIDFLHSRAQISHNNIELCSLFIDSRKKWKIGLFELSCKFDELSQTRLEVLELLKDRIGDKNATEYLESAPHGYDVYCFSRLALDILSNSDSKLSEFKTVLERSGLHASPKQRPRAIQLLMHSVFKSPFSYAISFLSDYVLKSDAERLKFFADFPKTARQIPEETLCSSIIPLILVPSVFTDYPAKSLVQHLLTPSKDKEDMVGLVSEGDFARLVVPHILRLFRCHELTTRLLLLQHFQAYARFIGHETLRTIVLPEVCLGVYDSNESLSAASLDSLAHLAHLLGPACAMTHLQSLGVQMESRSLLTTPAAAVADTGQYSVALGPVKALVYSTTKRPWRCARASAFPDAAPKANRQARDAPPDATSGDGAGAETRGLRLADKALLSANYVPMTAPPKRPQVVGPPVVKKLSAPKKLTNSRPFSRICPTVPGEEPPATSDGTEHSPLLTSPEGNASKRTALQSGNHSPQTNSLGSPNNHVAEEHLSLNIDDGNWNDWSSENEDEGLSAKPTASLSSKLPSKDWDWDAEAKAREAQVEALLAELEPTIPPASPKDSLLAIPKTSGDLSVDTRSLRYELEKTSGESKDDAGDEDGGWDVDDEEF